MRPVSGSLQGLFGTGQGGLTMSRTTKNHWRAKLRVLFQETRLRSGPNPSIRSRRHPGPARATPPCPCGLAVRPDVEPVGRLSRAGGGYTTSRTARTIYRGPMSSARTPEIPPASAPASPRTADSTFVEKFIHFCGGTVPRQALPFPSGGSINFGALEAPDTPLADWDEIRGRGDGRGPGAVPAPGPQSGSPGPVGVPHPAIRAGQNEQGRGGGRFASEERPRRGIVWR